MALQQLPRLIMVARPYIYVYYYTHASYYYSFFIIIKVFLPYNYQAQLLEKINIVSSSRAHRVKLIFETKNFFFQFGVIVFFHLKSFYVMLVKIINPFVIQIYLALSIHLFEQWTTIDILIKFFKNKKEKMSIVKK